MADTQHDFEQLIQAYANTDYWVSGLQTEVVLRIGEHPIWPANCAATNSNWIIITADNPGSERLTEEENRHQQRQLQGRLDSSGLPHWPSLARARPSNTTAAEPIWPDEAGWLVVGVTDTQIRQWCRDFGQLAVVHGHGSGPAQLLIMQDHPRAAALCKAVLNLPVWVTWLPAL